MLRVFSIILCWYWFTFCMLRFVLFIGLFHAIDTCISVIDTCIFISILDFACKSCYQSFLCMLYMLRYIVTINYFMFILMLSFTCRGYHQSLYVHYDFKLHMLRLLSIFVCPYFKLCRFRLLLSLAYSLKDFCLRWMMKNISYFNDCESRKQ